MAISIQQQPTTPNMANADLLFAVTSSQINQPQFQYVVDIYESGSSTIVQRVKQQVNPSGYGVFNLGEILTQNMPTSTGLGYEVAIDNKESIWTSDRVWLGNVDNAKQYTIYFGEEYGTSASSSVTLYDGAGSAGDPNVTGSHYHFFVDGHVDVNNEVNFNFNSGSKYAYENPMDDVTFTHQFGLTDFAATQSIRLGDSHTISFFNGNVSGEDPVTGVTASEAMDVYALTLKQYDSTGSLLDSSVYANLTVRAGTPTRWDAVYRNQQGYTRLVHCAVGPYQWEQYGVPLNANCAYYDCIFTSQATDTFPNDNGIWGSYRFIITEANCGYNGVRFIWKNKYGVWDYYNFELAESTNGIIERKSYNQSFVDYSSTTPIVSFDKARRGKNNYYNKVTKRRGAQTNYLTQAEADVIKELFYSTNVYIQDGTDFIPVTIETANLVEKTNPRTQKLYQYQIEYVYANDTRARN